MLVMIDKKYEICMIKIQYLNIIVIWNADYITLVL